MVSEGQPGRPEPQRFRSAPVSVGAGTDAVRTAKAPIATTAAEAMAIGRIHIPSTVPDADRAVSPAPLQRDTTHSQTWTSNTPGPMGQTPGQISAAPDRG